ncbi:MAG: response regulator [Deltaproteobacteria bacterium]|nr:response regulator [Deltaproteobacteria bacterium]
MPGQGRLRIVALTAHARRADRDDCIEAGMDDYVSKPFTKHDLREMLEKWAVSNSARAKEPAETGPAAGLTTLDPAVLKNLHDLQKQGASSDLVARVVDAFLKSSSELLDSMQNASNDAAPEGVAAAAHTLKSSSAQVGAQRLSALCKQVEQLGRDGTLDAVPALLENITSELEAVHDRLATERAILENG